jgi:hypothetical protein
MSCNKGLGSFRRRSRPAQASKKNGFQEVGQRPVTLSKAFLFKSAWQEARQGAQRFGGKPQDYFRAALTAAWGAFKSDSVTQGYHRLFDHSRPRAGVAPAMGSSQAIIESAARNAVRKGGLYAKLW